MKMLTQISFCLFILASLSSAQAPWSEFSSESSIPNWVHQLFNHNDLKKEYVFSYRINPFYLSGDFNGDGKYEIAILIRQNKSKKIGIAICHKSDSTVFIIGAGKRYLNKIDDFKWMDAWVVQRTEDSKDEISIRRTEAGGGTLSWNGKKYIWTQYQNE